MFRRPTGSRGARRTATLATTAPAAPATRLLPAADHAALLSAYRRLAPVGPAVEPRLRAVLADTVEHPGSFLRAQLAFGVGRGQGLDRETATALAIGVEYFHTASLLFDDLPMMDDAAERRGRPCPHRTHGEATTVLGALALVNEAYRLLWTALASLPAERSLAAAELVTDCLGAGGILSGQSRDLAPARGVRSEAEIRTVALQKTVSLIRLTLVLPALVGGADPAVRQLLDELARSWGLAYQVLDDCRDALMGSAETGKSTARDRALGRPNLLHHAGASRTLDRLDQLMRRSRAALERLPGDGDGDGWRALAALQLLLETECARVRRRLPSAAAAAAATAAEGVEALAV